MSFWLIVQFVVRWLPLAYSLIMMILKGIKELKNPAEQAIAINELWMAMKEARETGDLTPIEAMKDVCGLRCQIDRLRAQREARRARDA